MSGYSLAAVVTAESSYDLGAGQALRAEGFDSASPL
jgi:hypothetical protein